MAEEKKRPLQNSSAANVVLEAAISAAPMTKSIEEVYPKKTQLEHMLLRPDTYIGSVEKHTHISSNYDDTVKKTDGTKTEKLIGIDKREDANFAGGRNSDKCTLILTEGDSAKALAMAGLGVVGRELDEMEKSDVEAEEARLKNQKIPKLDRQPPKNPRKNVQKPKNSETSTESQEVSSGSMMEIGKVAEVVKPKGKAETTKKPPVKKQQPKLVLDDDEDDKVAELKELLAANNLESSPDHLAEMEMELEVLEARAKEKEPSTRAAAQKRLSAEVAGISEEDEDQMEQDLEEVKAPQGAAKQGGKKKKTIKPPPAAKPQILSKKLSTQILKPAQSSGISLQKKLRKRRGGKKVSKVNLDSDTDSADDAFEKAIIATATSRPQRVTRKQVSYVYSDSESDEASEDSDFNEDDY